MRGPAESRSSSTAPTPTRHFPFTRDELGCDYYGTSLHKWLLAPIGAGFLYVRKDKQKKLWPLMAAAPEQDENIRKYEEIGTHPAANHNAISAALAFHRGHRRGAQDRPPALAAGPLGQAAAGRERPCPGAHPARLPHMRGRSGSSLSTGWTWSSWARWLLDKHRIVNTPIGHPEFTGLRITPNVYTTPDEIDIFAEKVLESIKKGMA